MIAYLDSSGLAKLVVREAESAEVEDIVRAASHVASSRIAYPEVAAAIARRHRAGEFDEPTAQELVARLERRWNTMVVLDFDELEAGRLAQAHPLRGTDAVHLACALALATATSAATVRFVSYDARQVDAAAAEGLAIAA